MLQGLSDPEEFVVSRCIGAMASLTEIDLLQKAALYELLKDTTPYLLHPNLWIRQATAGIQFILIHLMLTVLPCHVYHQVDLVAF